MAKKSNTVDTKIKNNPLSIVLGMFLSRERNKLPDNNSSKEIAQKIGFTGISFYRMIEAGLANLHPSKVLDVLKVFPLSNINFDAFCKYLVAIQLVETRLNSYPEFNDAIYQLSVTDEKLKKLFNVLKPAFKEIEKNPQEFKDAFNSEQYYNEIKEYLSNHEQYATFTSDVQQKNKIKLTNVFSELPTIYYDFVEAFVKQLHTMPVSIKFNELWNWEQNNKDRFERLIAIVAKHSFVTDYENLKDYKYWYLWERDFKEIKILFLDEDNPTKVKECFQTNLLKAIKEDSELLGELEKKFPAQSIETIVNIHIDKVTFKKCEMNQDVINNENQNSFWAFYTHQKTLIGFLAYINPDNVKLVEGKSLSNEETLKKVKALENMWTDL